MNGKNVKITLTKEQVDMIKRNSLSIKERINSSEDALKELGETDEDVIQYRKLQSITGLAKHILNNQLAIVIVKALNEGHVFDWNDFSEYKYFISWTMGTFSYYYYNYWSTSSFFFCSPLFFKIRGFERRCS